MNRKGKFGLHIRLLALSLLMVAGCAKETLLSLQKMIPPTPTPAGPETARASADFCTRPSQTSYGNTKFLFVLDKSGSNLQNYICKKPDPNNSANCLQPWTPMPGTDPNGYLRYGAIRTFLNNPLLVNNTNIYYGLITFNTSISVVSSFTNQLGAFTTAIDLDSNPNGITPPDPNDVGYTDYEGALGKILSLMNQEIQSGGSPTNYVIFWVSDGAPVMSTGLESTSTILKDVDQVYALQQTHSDIVASLQVNAAYYHYNTADADPVARSLMQSMAQHGGGQFFELSNGDTLDFSRYPIPEYKTQFQLKDVFVRNVNTVWYNGALERDSDGDGLSDKQELLLGSDPNKADSDDNGLSDFAEFYAKGKPCADAHCDPHFAIVPPASCQKYLTGAIPPSYSSTTGDEFNDCEKIALLSTDVANPTAPGSWVPLWLMASSGLGLANAQATLASDPDMDGLTNYEEIKYNTPLFVANSSIPNVIPYQYNLQMTSSDSNQTCYHLDTDQIPVLGTGNQVRIYLLEGSVFNSNHLIREATKSIDDSNNTVTFSSEDFPVAN